ncbi:MAG: trigger factor [Desulfobacterales bacterium]|jgi:trigger factor|nr:trigger factor [Desulfobacterales bacterium]
MEITIEDISSVKKKLNIHIPHDTVVKEIESAYVNLKKSAKIKGYRPGKAPRPVLERVFKKDLHSEVASNLIQSTLIDAIKQKDLAVIGTPKVEPTELNPDSAYSYHVTVELKPKLSPITFKGIELNKKLYKVSDAEIDKQIELLQRQVAQYVKISEDRPCRDGDFVVIDYEGFKDGAPFEETQKTQNYTLKIGQGMISDDFDKQIAGMKSGDEKEFTIHFPDTYHNKKLAGLDISFKAALRDIREQKLPELDNEFAASLGKYETIDEVKAEIRKSLQEGYDKRVQQELQEQVFEKLLTESFEIPDTLVQFELDNIIYDTAMRFAQSNISMEQVGLTREKMETQYRDVAEKQVRRHLFLSQIIEQEKLDISDTEMESEYETFASAVGQKVEIIKDYYKKNPDKAEGFKLTLLEKKAFNLIIDNADVKEVEPETNS